MMGMGEPLQNYAALLPALRTMLDDHGYGLSRRRVTVSTSGVVPMIERLRDDCPVALAVSLHAPDDALRDELVPLNRKYPIAELLAACRSYLARAPRDFITLEYCMLDGVNDSPEQAHALLALVRGDGSAARAGLQDQPDSVQPVPGLGPAPLGAGAGGRLRRGAAAGRGSSPPCARRAATTSPPPAASSPARCRTAPASPSAACARCRCGSSAASPDGRARPRRRGARHDARRPPPSRRLLIAIVACSPAASRDAAAEPAPAPGAGRRHRDQGPGHGVRRARGAAARPCAHGAGRRPTSARTR